MSLSALFDTCRHRLYLTATCFERNKIWQATKTSAIYFNVFIRAIRKAGLYLRMIGAIEIMFIPAGFTLDSMIFISWRIQDALHILSVTNYNILTQLRAFSMLIGIHYILIKAKLRFEWKQVFSSVYSNRWPVSWQLLSSITTI